MGTVTLPYKDLKPSEIETKSMEIIRQELCGMDIDLKGDEAPIIMRTIHTTADFDYARNLYFSENAVSKTKDAIRNGACIVTDTNMARSGINAKKYAAFGCDIYCYMADDDIVKMSEATGRTRASLSMDKAARLDRDIIFAVGNAPTALIRLHELVSGGILKPKGIIGVPVGFVNVVEAKELILELPCPHIVARGRKGGSTVAAAICNALVYNI